MPRPDAKKSAQHLSTFAKIAERAQNRRRVRNGVEAGGKQNVAASSVSEDTLKTSMPSSLADVVLSASSSARAAASVDVPDARTPQSLLAALKKKKKPAALQNSRISSLKSPEPRNSAKSTASTPMKLPPSEFTKIQRALTARGAPEHSSPSADSGLPGSRWGQVSSTLATGGSKELAAVEGGATFVHKARERFMDVDSSTFWELVCTSVP